MSRITSIEDLLVKITDLEGIDDEKALNMVNDFMKNSKKKTWSKSMAELMKKYIEIIIYQNQIKYFKEALIFCRSLTQANYIEQFEGIVKKAKEILLEKYKESSEKYKDFKISHRSLLEEEKESDFHEEYFSDSPNALEEELFLKEQKFIWEAYKTLLDLTKTNSKLFNLYSQILKDCFTFCGENQRNHEFKALCDSVRNHLYTLKKNENKPNFANKIQISDPKILKILIQTSLNQIETANKLEEWEESFRTSEKIVSFIEEYEKIQAKDQDGSSSKKNLKIPPIFEIELYNYIQKLLWVANYPLYHTYAMTSIKDILDINKSKLVKINEKEKEKLNSFNLGKINEKIILAFLATPIKNAYTNFTKIGEELYEENNDTEIKTCMKMMKILKVSHIPSRKYLFGYILNNKIIDNSCSDIKELFELFEYEENPIILAKKGVKYINRIFNNEKENEYTTYLQKIQENLIIKVMMMMPKIYKNISLRRVINLFKDLKIEEYEISDIICESSRYNLFKCKIDTKNDIIKFITNESCQEQFNTLIEEFLKQSKKVIRDIIYHKNMNKINILKTKIYEEIRNNNTKSLETTNNLLEETKKQNKKLKAYISKKDKLKAELKERTAETKEMKKRILQEREQLEREELKDQQKKKEYETEIKKRVIDLLRQYTNSVVLKEGKRIKLDDLLKDLNKISEEELIKQLTDQENESVLKKEKELKKETKKKDYVLREFRKRDFDKYSEDSKKKWEKSNERYEKEEKEFYDNYIGIQDKVLKFKPYKDEYCNEIEKKNKEIYEKEVEEYNKYLEKRVTDDIYNELDAYFEKYFQEFTLKEQEENEQKKAQEIWMPRFNDRKSKGNITRSSNYTEVKIVRESGIKEFDRSGRAAENLEVEKERNKKMEGFRRGEKFLENQKEEEEKKKSDKKEEWIRGKNLETKKDEKKEEKKDIKKGEKWERGGKAENKKEDKKDDKKEWIRGSNTETKKEDKKDDKKGWIRGANAEPKKENKKDDKKEWIRGGNAEAKKEDKKDDKKGWIRGANAEPKKEDKKDDKKEWIRGGNVESKKEDKKEEKGWIRGGNADKKDQGFARGSKAETKKEEKKEEGFARGSKAEPKKEEKKEEGFARGSKAEPKKEEKKEEGFARSSKAEPKKEEKKKKKKKNNLLIINPNYLRLKTRT